MLGGKARFHLKPYASRRVWIPRFNLETNIRFIEEYRKHPCLWNPDASDYMKHKPRFKAYEDIAKAMQYPGLDAASVRSKIKILRSCYISSRKQIASKAGTSTPHKPVDWFWAADSFLHDVIRLGFSEPENIRDEYRYLKQNFDNGDQNSPGQAEVFFGADMPVSTTVEVFDSGNDGISGEEINEDVDDESPANNSNNPVSIKTEAADDSEMPDNSIYLELDDDQLMAIENGEMSIEEVAAKAEAAASQQQAATRRNVKHQQQRKPKKSISTPVSTRAAPTLQVDEQAEHKYQPKPSGEDKGEEIQSAESEPEDEFDVFGRCVSLQLKALPFEMALDLESQIHTLITKKRMDLLRKNKLHTHSQSDSAQ